LEAAASTPLSVAACGTGVSAKQRVGDRQLAPGLHAIHSSAFKPVNERRGPM
jgi:hypothetical protein